MSDINWLQKWRRFHFLAIWPILHPIHAWRWHIRPGYKHWRAA